MRLVLVIAISVSLNQLGSPLRYIFVDIFGRVRGNQVDLSPVLRTQQQPTVVLQSTVRAVIADWQMADIASSEHLIVIQLATCSQVLERLVSLRPVRKSLRVREIFAT